MKKIFESVDEVMSNCCNSVLKTRVASTLSVRSAEGAKWNFVFAVEDGDKYYAIFDMPIKNSGIVFYQSSYGSPQIDRNYISTTKPAPIEVRANLM